MLPMTDPTSTLKAALRDRAKLARAAQTAAERTASGLALADHGIDWVRPPPEPGRTIVSGFLAIGDELDTMPLLRALHARGYPLCLPVMQGRGLSLLFRSWRPDDPLNTRQWGIREPCDASPLVTPDLLLVPLLAFDRTGQRLGYGGGYYDRTLAQLRQRQPILAIGVACAAQEVDAVPHLDYDQILDGVLTETGGRRFPRNQAG
jgi:5-formyltetrahydrofolate cyclo-ligase